MIDFQFTYWSLPALVALAVCLATYLQLRQNARVAGARALKALLAMTTLWSFTQLAITLTTSLAVHAIITPFSYIGIAAVPVGWFMFCVTYSMGNDRTHTSLLPIVSLIPIITIVMAFTNSHHELLWTGAELTNTNGYIGVSYSYGLWFTINAAYSYVLILIGTSIIAFNLSQTNGHKGPLFAVITAPSIVIALNVVYLAPQNPLPGLDLTTAGFALGILIINNWVMSHGMLTTNKVVRQQVVEQLREGVIVVSDNGLVLDANPEALSILQLTDDITFNQPLDSMTNNPSLLELVSSHRRNTEVGINGRSYEVTVSKYNEHADSSDSILVFRDVTDRRKAEHALRQATHKLQHAAHTDALTGLPNRRVFMKRLSEEAERVRRHGNELSVLLFDLDHFKKINDTYGHDVGDRVLQKVAEVIQQVKRITDVSARTGGEEFALLLPETDEEGAMRLAKRLLISIAHAEVEDNNGAPVQVTSSIGVSTVNQIDTLEGFLREADAALYRAKDKGRNQVCMAYQNVA